MNTCYKVASLKLQGSPRSRTDKTREQASPGTRRRLKRTQVQMGTVEGNTHARLSRQSDVTVGASGLVQQAFVPLYTGLRCSLNL